MFFLIHTIFSNILFFFSSYVRTSALQEDLLYFNPKSSAHINFKNYLEVDSGVYTSSSSGHKRRRRSRRRKSCCDLEAAEGELEASAADEMPIVINLAPNDIANVKSSWNTIEAILLQVNRANSFGTRTQLGSWVRYPKEMPWWINQYYYHFDNIEQWYNYQCNIISRTDIIRLIYFSDVVAKTYFTFLVEGSTYYNDSDIYGYIRILNK